MQISRCPVCKNAGFLIFRRKGRSRREWPHVGHSKSGNKPKKWCYITKAKLSRIEIPEDWYTDYKKLIEELFISYDISLNRLSRRNVSDKHLIESRQMYRLLDEGRIRSEFSGIPFSNIWNEMLLLLQSKRFPRAAAVDKIHFDFLNIVIDKGRPYFRQQISSLNS